ncbi:hypothetical protein [Subtercola sp. YIM 133946]|uniref:hypothetical protein n=1 Tax=Subtercola sp. YIM 133946 TaxID=3118909 RepID=UPI002F9245EE
MTILSSFSSADRRRPVARSRFVRSLLALTVAGLVALAAALAVPSAAEAGTLTAAKTLTATPTPTLSGTTTVGHTLAITAGSWAPAPVTLAYQWKRGGTAIAGATAKTYTLTNADAGSTITASVTGTKTGYLAVSKTSAPSATIGGGTLATATPTVSGTARVGQKLSSATGSWGPAPVSFTYAWLRDGVVISGATSSYHTLTPADAGHSVAVRVTGSKGSFTSASKTSAAVKVSPGILTAPAPAAPEPTIPGSIDPGDTITVPAGTWSPAPVALSYQWMIDGTAVAGATSTSFVIPATAGGEQVSVAVTGAKAGYTTRTLVSKEIKVSVPK